MSLLSQGLFLKWTTFKTVCVNEPKDFSQEEAEALAAPLLDTLQRLTYEVTEIALDRPGINLEF